MSRPKPIILLEYTNEKYFSEQVLEADAIYAVFYNDKPINLKSVNNLDDFASAKYKKTSFSNKAHAVRLANRLNKRFNTTEFSVRKLIDGNRVEEGINTRDNKISSRRN